MWCPARQPPDQPKLVAPALQLPPRSRVSQAAVAGHQQYTLAFAHCGSAAATSPRPYACRTQPHHNSPCAPTSCKPLFAAGSCRRVMATPSLLQASQVGQQLQGGSCTLQALIAHACAPGVAAGSGRCCAKELLLCLFTHCCCCRQAFGAVFLPEGCNARLH